MSEQSSYDVVIIGGGPAGLTAGLYTARARLNSLLIEKLAIGGQIVNAELVENFPGFPEGISGLELSELMHQQATKFGLQTLLAEVTGVEFDKAIKTIRTRQGDYHAKAVIIASGSERVKLGAPGEEKFTGRGVSYCATCDSAFFQGVPVLVVGGGDASLTEALHLTKHASSVSVIHRRHELRATKIMQDRATAEPKIRFVWDSVVQEIEGDEMVTRVKLANVKTGVTSYLKAAGVFVSIGFDPATELVKGQINLDEAGQIITNEMMETSVRGVFAAGDIRRNSGRQAVTAAGDGATSAIYAQRYLAGI